MVHELVLADADAAQRLAWVRLWWRGTHRRARIGQRLYVGYTAVIFIGMYGLVAYGSARSVLPAVLDPRALATFGPSLLLAGLLVAARWGAYQGPVVFSPADVAFLLGAPISRRALATRRLVIALVLGAAAGMLLAGVALVGLGGDGRGVAADRAAALVVGFADLGVLGVAGAWAVERSARWEAALSRVLWPSTLLAAAAAAAAAAAGETGRHIVLWSGPWGWAAHPGAGTDRAQWLAALALLTLLAAGAASAALRSCGDCPTERHARRAEGRAGATASLASFDARTARQALQAVAPRSRAVRAGGLRRLRDLLVTFGSSRSATPATVWRDAVAAAGAPGRTLQGALLAAAGTVLGLVESGDPIRLAAALVLVYAGASRLLTTLRAELDVTPRARLLLRAPLGRVLLAHVLVPVVVAGLGACLAAVGCAVAGALPPPGTAAAVAVAAVVLVTGCAAMSARRGGRMPPALIVVGTVADPSGGGVTVISWLLCWPMLAGVLGGVPVLLVRSGGLGPGLLALCWIVAMSALLTRCLTRDLAEP